MWRRREPSPVAVRRRPGQGQPYVAAAGGVVEAFHRVREAYPDLPLEVEVDTVAQARDVIDAGAELVLLDNMAPEALREVVAYVRDWDRAPSSRHRAVSPSTGRSKSRRPASTTWPSAR